MHRIFRKDQVLTIPNLLSVIRLALIPLIVWLYIGKQEYSAAVAVILISGATDIIDGFIARKFNMVSDLGKILDPVADKLTQATVILCLTVKYRWMRGLIVLFVVKEIIMAVLGYRMFIRMRSGRLGSGTAGLDGERSKNQLFSGASLLCALGGRRNAERPRSFKDLGPCIIAPRFAHTAEHSNLGTT